MNHPEYFFCAVGGTGMLSLAQILLAQGARITGSDRAHDLGLAADKFSQIARLGIRLVPQDGSGPQPGMEFISSGAVEDDVADMVAARRLGLRMRRRAELLAELFNAATSRVAVAGTSGKSTTTGMLAWILHQAGQRPTVMNGAVMKNFITSDHPLPMGLGGDRALFITEADESDGSIRLYRPQVGILSGISLDHQSEEALQALFTEYTAACGTVILNWDSSAVRMLDIPARVPVRRYALHRGDAELRASGVILGAASAAATLHHADGTLELELALPGEHNIANAMAALLAAQTLGVPLAQGVLALRSFAGIRRRLELVGQAAGVTVIDDFAHNPEKIAASLSALRQTPGRLLVFYQWHGFKAFRMTAAETARAITEALGAEDIFFTPEQIYYAGGTADKNVSPPTWAAGIAATGLQVHCASRPALQTAMLAAARTGDRLVIIGARDESLSDLARELVRHLQARDQAA